MFHVKFRLSVVFVVCPGRLSVAGEAVAEFSVEKRLDVDGVMWCFVCVVERVDVTPQEALGSSSTESSSTESSSERRNEKSDENSEKSNEDGGENASQQSKVSTFF